MEKIIYPFFALLLLLSPFATANQGYKYSPPGCDFEATFPGEPGLIKRCPSDATLPCYEVAQYTERAEEGQTINVEMTCTIINSEIYESYNQYTMEQIIYNMVQDANLPEAPPVRYQEDEGGLKIVGTSGLKTTGFATKIFVSQAWLKPNSLMTVEAEMSLESDEDGDKKFADILRSIMPIEQPQSAPEAQEPEAE